jgi:hypothetical protein
MHMDLQERLSANAAKGWGDLGEITDASAARRRLKAGLPQMRPEDGEEPM